MNVIVFIDYNTSGYPPRKTQIHTYMQKIHIFFKYNNSEDAYLAFNGQLDLKYYSMNLMWGTTYPDMLYCS